MLTNACCAARSPHWLVQCGISCVVGALFEIVDGLGGFGLIIMIIIEKNSLKKILILFITVHFDFAVYCYLQLPLVYLIEIIVPNCPFLTF